jgi:dUTP pyrophosphatase
MPQNTDPAPSEGAMFDFSVKVRRVHPAAKLPARGTNWSAGADLACLEAFTLNPGERRLVSTGLAVEIPPGWYGRVAPRSGLAANRGIDMLGGVIDSDYRSELKVLMINLGEAPASFDAGDRIAQLIIERAAVCDYVWADELSETERGDGGFGSTGK